MTSERDSARGFTLVELLVVIAIIAVLAAILFPVFARVRAKARQAHCSSNIRQVAMALRMYADDHDGCAPLDAYDVPGTAFYDEEWGPTCLVWWDFVLPYVRSKDLFYCPLKRISIYGYFINWYLDARHSPIGAQLDMCSYPSETILGTETANVVHVNTPMTDAVSWTVESAFRHNIRLNTAFVDGHVKAMGRKPLEVGSELWLPVR